MTPNSSQLIRSCRSLAVRGHALACLKSPISLLLAGLLPILLTGCASTKPPSGFLSSYTQLKPEGGNLVYRSPKLREYSRFIVDPVQLQIQRDPPVLKPEEKAEVARYFRDAVINVLTTRGHQLSDRPDVGVARIRIAITDVWKAKWYVNLHPATKASGLGTGGASMEAEIIDSVTGDQLGAAIRTASGNQFELDTFSSLDDVKDAIQRWAREVGARLDEIQKTAPR